MYVHNKSHCLDLAIVHSCNNVSVRNAMSTVQEVAFAFDYSGKKLQAFFDELEADATTKENMGGGGGEGQNYGPSVKRDGQVKGRIVYL